MDADAHMIPEDIVFSILLWLPVASLVRFKSVCKSWFSIIESSAFIYQHLLSEHKHHLLILSPNQTIPNHPCFSLSFTLLSDHRSKDFHFSPHPIHKPFRLPHLAASFNGLVFVRDEYCTNAHYLWNPATKQVKTLPFPPSNIKVDGPWSETSTHLNYGFGFDLKTNDYKIVRLVSQDFIIDRKPIKTRVEVYSLKMDSWTETKHLVVPPNFIISSDPKSPFKNQIYCWLGWDYIINDPVHRKSILSYDFTNEVFGVIPLPDVYVVDFTYILTLAFLREQLACVDWVYDSTKTTAYLSCCKIWVLEEYGVKESWTKLYTIVLDSPVFAVRSFINGMIIWDPLNDETILCSCDPVTQELHNLPFQGEIAPLILADYKESLVSIASRNGKQIG